MNTNTFVRVGYLQVGLSYFLRLHTADNDKPVFTKVKFINITNCPAVVIVQDAKKDQIRCNRSDLYIPVR